MGVRGVIKIVKHVSLFRQSQLSVVDYLCADRYLWRICNIDHGALATWVDSDLGFVQEYAWRGHLSSPLQRRLKVAERTQRYEL